ncbi:hypothetical protein C1H46_009643 [Malus baccata]|uniref:Uncharacterized protein n=1 Tax=Malus baccata TaxID=106549 RepID=A0A540N2N9_MALBA|nr:hypothetical protein C1H46_009643 [Malus baccata]
MCGDATNWDEEVYRESILKEREIRTRTVWAQSLNPSPETVVVASSYGSVSSYSIPFLISKLPLGFSNVKAPHCGDDGQIQGWRWKDCEELCVPLHLQGKHVKPVLDLVNPQHKPVLDLLGPWGALSPIPENNALAVDNKEGCIFSAAGDSCVYCWDVKCLRKEVKSNDFQGACILRAFCRCSEFYQSDCKSGKCVQVYEPAKGIKLKGFFACVSCIALDANESWLACSSGQSLSVWNLLASECISRVSTRASIQDVVFDENQSAFSISLHPSGVIAVGGYSGLVDVMSQFGSHLCTFGCRCV